MPRLIDAGSLLDTFRALRESPTTLRDAIYLDCVMGIIETEPTIDAVVVTRCGKCIKRHTSMCHAGHEQADMDYCSYGERKEKA